MVARHPHKVKVAGSSPAPATDREQRTVGAAELRHRKPSAEIDGKRSANRPTLGAAGAALSHAKGIDMLVLVRKAGQTLKIGNAVVQILSVRGKEIRIGIEAPKDVKVLRGEVAERDESSAGTN